MALIKNKISNLTNKKPEPTDQAIRVNGWTHPFHCLQIIAWIFYLLMSFICFAFIVPTLPNTTIRCIVLATNSILFLVHLVTHITAVQINPADDNVISKLDTNRDRPKFDRSKHSHVIENQFCYICETNVGTKSKHCSLCNKCVSNFDHHCKWLNNCVGGKNYIWFTYCVLSALMGTAVIFVNCIVLTIAYFSANSWLYDPNSTLLFFNSQSNVSKILQKCWIVIIISSLILSLIAVVLLTHLIGFHLFLKCMGLSTYEFVVNRRKDKSLISGILNDSERNKLVNYLTHLQKCLSISVCTRKRVKPSDIDIHSDSHSADKLSKEKQFIESVVNDVANADHREAFDISEVMKDIENSNKEIKVRDNKPKVSPLKSGQQIESKLTVNEVNKSSKKTTDSGVESNATVSPAKTTTPEETANDINVMSRAANGVDYNEPIFKPLGEGEGRTSRLSFVNKSDFIVPSVWADSGFASIPSSTHLYIRYNTYKLNDNRLHRKRRQTNHWIQQNNDNNNQMVANNDTIANTITTNG